MESNKFINRVEAEVRDLENLVERVERKPLHFWFSAKQSRGFESLTTSFFEEEIAGGGTRAIPTRNHEYTMFVRIDGVEHEYTERTEADKPNGKWDDYVFLGVATTADTFSRRK